MKSYQAQEAVAPKHVLSEGTQQGLRLCLCSPGIVIQAREVLEVYKCVGEVR
jgi:hypothetical protein